MRKEPQIRRLEKNQRKKKKAESGSPEAAKDSGSLRRVAQLRQDKDNLKETPKNTRNERQICPSQTPEMQQEK